MVPPIKCLHWMDSEVDRLGVCWCSVSTQKGGPGAGQKEDGLWAKITIRYHSQDPPPPVPTNSRNQACQARNLSSLQAKWKRTTPLLSAWMKCHTLALANPKSGESEQGIIDRAMSAYMKNPLHKHKFPHLSTYELIKGEPKWKVECEKVVREARQASEATVETVIEQLDRQVDAPTCASTKKPEGVKRARRSMNELAVMDREIAKVERKMESWLDSYTHRKELATIVIAAADRRSRSLQDTANDKIWPISTSGMEGDELEYYLERKMHALQDVRRETKKRAAEELAEAEALRVDLAAAWAAAAVAQVGVPDALAVVAVVEAEAAVTPPHEVTELSEDEEGGLFDRFQSRAVVSGTEEEAD